jgi:hypothetical protein
MLLLEKQRMLAFSSASLCLGLGFSGGRYRGPYRNGMAKAAGESGDSLMLKDAWLLYMA